MAIQHRRGAYTNFDPTRLLPGEWAIVLSGDTATSDGMAAYMCFAAGKVKRMATYDDLYREISSIEADITQDLVNITETAAQEAHDAAVDVGNYGLRIGWLESWVSEHELDEATLEELKACCTSVKGDLVGLAFTLAALSGAWQVCADVAIAPTAAACSVSGTLATIAGTVSDTLLTLS